MEQYHGYFPTKAYKLAELKMNALLCAERDRLDALAKSLNREHAIGPDNLAQQVPQIMEFVKGYHKAYMNYLDAVMPQQPKPIQCRPACGNCCHHYPMSVEPFELIYLYHELRKREDFISIMESCQARSSLFESLYGKRLESGLTEDEAEDKALHDYFSKWKPCMFSDYKGDCGVYQIRPVSCRMYFSETDPKFCVPEHLQTPANESYIVYLPDVAEEAIYGISEHYEDLDLPDSYFGGVLALNIYEGLFA